MYRNFIYTLKSFSKDDIVIVGVPVYARAAFIGQHSFSETLAKDRPDEKDMDIVSDFADIGYLKHKEELEINFIYRKEPELFL